MDRDSVRFGFVASQVRKQQSVNTQTQYGLNNNYALLSFDIHCYSKFMLLLCIVSPAEILLGGVYIWGNPQLCFPEPNNIMWKDTLDEQNIHAGKYQLQARASNCEHLIDF